MKESFSLLVILSCVGLGVGLTCFECDGANDERCNENEGWATTQVDTRTCVAKSDGFEFFRCYKMRTAVNERWVHTRGCVEDHATFASLLCGTSEEDNNLQVYNNSLRKPTGSTSSGSKYSGSKHSGSKWSSWSGSTWTKWSGTKSKSGKTRSRKKSKSHPQVHCCNDRDQCNSAPLGSAAPPALLLCGLSVVLLRLR